MSIHAHRHGEESNDRLQQRFKSQVQKSGFIKKLREKAHHKRKPSKRVIRLRALVREKHREENRQKKFYSNM